MLDNLFSILAAKLKQSISSYCELDSADDEYTGSVADYRSSEMISILCILRIYCFVICSTFQVVGILKKS